MHCVTVKSGVECPFMAKAGCGYSGGSCLPVVESCEGCHKIMEVSAGKFCSSYPNPVVKWKTGNCNFATHLSIEAKKAVKVNPLKASKRAKKKA